MIEVAWPHLAVADITVVVRSGVAPGAGERGDDGPRVQLVLGHLDHLGAVEKERRVARRRAQLLCVLAPAAAIAVEHGLDATVLDRVELAVGRRPARRKRELADPGAASAVELPGERDAARAGLPEATRERVMVKLVIAVAAAEVARRPLVARRVAADREPQAVLVHVSARAVEESGLRCARAAEMRHEVAVHRQVGGVADQVSSDHDHRAGRVGGHLGDQAELVHRVVDLQHVGERAIVGYARAGDALRRGVEEKARSIRDEKSELTQVVGVDGWIEHVGQGPVRGGEPYVRLAAVSRADGVLVTGRPSIRRHVGDRRDV